MRFTGRYTTVNDILERLRRKFPFFEDVYEEECKEWIWDIMGKIGITTALEDCVADITIEEHSGTLPSDLYSFDFETGIREKGTNIPLLPTTDIFFANNTEDTTLSQAIIAGTSFNVTYDNVGDEITSQLDDSTINIDAVYPSGYMYEKENYTYRIQGSYIFSGLEETTLEIIYKGFPIWDDMTPKIPDEPKYLDMVVMELATIIAMRLWMSDKLSKDKFDWIEQEASYLKASTRSFWKIPDKDEMENISRMRMRLLPKPAQFDTGFRYLSSREKLRKM